VLEGQIYLVGGCSPGGRAVVGDTQIYDPATNTWSTGAPLPTPICYASAAVVDNVLYIIGGGSDAGGQLSYTNLVWAYSPDTKTWSARTAMPTARGDAAVAVANNTIYVIGGWNGSAMSTVEGYNPASDAWTEETPLLVSKVGSSAGLIGTTIVAAAGLVDPNPTGTGDNEGYNVSSDVWTSLQADPTARGNGCAGVIGTQLYVAGGYNNGPAVAVTESFNLSRNLWKTLAPMPQATSWGGSAVYGGELYCFGSTDGYSGPLLLQIYQP
jgi:N-acetylneuraminic acid mutarotase